MPDHLFATYFNTTHTVYQSSAPGRIDVMGGIADYSGSMVLQMPIREKTTVQLALRDDDKLNIKSLQSNGEVLACSVAYHSLLKNGREVDYAFARKELATTENGRWAGYIIGCFLVVQKEKNIQITGADIFIHTEVPLGKGVSSSAALEVAVLKAIAQAYQIEFGKTELPLLAQKAENLVVGAPCGLMDQLACYLGESGKLLPILCQPDIVYEPLPIPENIFFIGIDSGIRHSVGAASYSQVRTAAFMGYAMIAREVGVMPKELEQAKLNSTRKGLPFDGYVANITPSIFEERFALRLPYKMHGKYFKQHQFIHLDTATEVLDDKFYAILDCTRHPVYENFRVHTFSVLLHYLSVVTNPLHRKQCLQQLGELMYQSHTGYSVCGLGDDHTDELVESVRQHQHQGVYGAKITGGGSGGTVCILCEGEEGLQTARKIHRQYQEKYNKEVTFFEP
ncbi:GHMP kinase [Rhodocytophaga rosea]|uniref:GHMP kinase n=1 Tax=Rhodocytophaga rosea TaxID=2704465 RepID=A0A6C0GM45_9BACT|nr:galactokinase family protein [Rhodocytophaga rosea]QHT69108.1 GHMP kinase [Rhodocytophaga rosea]